MARTDAEAARLITSDIDEYDAPFVTGERTAEGFYRLKGGIDAAIVRRSAPVSTSSYFFPVWEAESAFTPVSYAARGDLPAEMAEEAKQSASKLHGLPRELIDEWDAYAVRWRQFLDSNPKARIATFLSESHHASSSP
jgi:hypothetical protein